MTDTNLRENAVFLNASTETPRAKEVITRRDSNYDELALGVAFREFCASTSLHGWHHLNRVSSHGRLVWMVIVLASLGVASVFLFTAAQDFMTRSVVTTIDTTTASLNVRPMRYIY